MVHLEIFNLHVTAKWRIWSMVLNFGAGLRAGGDRDESMLLVLDRYGHASPKKCKKRSKKIQKS